MQEMNNLFDTFGAYSMMEEAGVGDILVKPNLITGEGRTRVRGSFWKDKKSDLKKKERRKMAKKSKRQNRRK